MELGRFFVDMIVDSDKKNKHGKSLKDYFLEFKKLAEYKKVWLISRKNNKYKNINIKVNKEFFIHMIGLQKLPIYKCIKNNKLVERIEKEIIDFDSIYRAIKSLKKTRKDLKIEIKHVLSKIEGLKNIESFLPEKIFKEFNLVIFDNKILKRNFPYIKSEICLLKRNLNKLFLLHLSFINNTKSIKKNKKLCYFKSFTFLKINLEKKEKNVACEILKCKIFRIVKVKFIGFN